MILYRLLLTLCLSLSTGSLPLPMVLYYVLLGSCLYLWHSTTFYWPITYTYGPLLPSTDPLPIPMVLYYLLLATAYTNGTLLSSTAPGLSKCYLLLYPCLYLWYSTTFYWLPDYPYGTLLFSTGPLPDTIVLAHLLLAHCLLYYPLLAPCLSI